MAIPKQVQQQHELALAMMRGEADAQPTEKTENEAPTPESTSEGQASSEEPVSYTHLTLPTIYSV